MCRNCSHIPSNCNNWKGYKEISGSFFRLAKRGAKERGIEFSVTIEQIWKQFILQKRKCALSGLPLFFKKRHISKNHNASLDRIDNNKGYILNNIQWVHKDINKMKLDHTQNYFIEMCKLVAYNNQP